MGRKEWACSVLLDAARLVGDGLSLPAATADASTWRHGAWCSIFRLRGAHCVRSPNGLPMAFGWVRSHRLLAAGSPWTCARACRSMHLRARWRNAQLLYPNVSHGVPIGHEGARPRSPEELASAARPLTTRLVCQRLHERLPCMPLRIYRS